MDAVNAHFRPEFINRIDEVVVFEPLAREQIAGIAEIQLGLRKRLAEREPGTEPGGAGQADRRRLRPGSWRTPAEAGHPALDRAEPAGATDPGPVPAPGASISAKVEGDEIVFA